MSWKCFVRFENGKTAIEASSGSKFRLWDSSGFQLLRDKLTESSLTVWNWPNENLLCNRLQSTPLNAQSCFHLRKIDNTGSTRKKAESPHIRHGIVERGSDLSTNYLERSERLKYTDWSSNYLELSERLRSSDLSTDCPERKVRLESSNQSAN